MDANISQSFAAYVLKNPFTSLDENEYVELMKVKEKVSRE